MLVRIDQRRTKEAPAGVDCFELDPKLLDITGIDATDFVDVAVQKQNRLLTLRRRGIHPSILDQSNHRRWWYMKTAGRQSAYLRACRGPKADKRLWDGHALASGVPQAELKS
jgi:hypothetical protein